MYQRGTGLRRLPAAGFTRDQPKELPRCCISSAGRLQQVHMLAFLSISRRTLCRITSVNCLCSFERRGDVCRNRHALVTLEFSSSRSWSASWSVIGLGNALPEKPMFDSLRPFRFFDSSRRQGCMSVFAASARCFRHDQLQL